MENIGEVWRKNIVLKAAEKERQDVIAAREKEQRAIEEAISKFTKVVAAASAKGEESVRVSERFLRDEDMAAYRPEQRRCAFADLHAANAIITSSHLVCLERHVVGWCHNNGLECFLERYQPNDINDSYEYHLCARPKSVPAK